MLSGLMPALSRYQNRRLSLMLMELETELIKLGRLADRVQSQRPKSKIRNLRDVY